jgi:DedD protein
MAESEEALQLKRRARRRLVGAVALVTFAVIILPLILDKEPGPAGPPLSVQIPSQESSGFTTPVVPPAPQAPAAQAPEKKAESPPAKADIPAVKAEIPAVKAEPPGARTETAAIKAITPAAKPVTAPAADKADEARAQAALNDEAWVVTLGAFSNPDNAKRLQAKLSAAGVKSYTEMLNTGKGEQKRVRAGPFPSKEAAEKVRAKLDAMGLKPGAVSSR